MFYCQNIARGEKRFHGAKTLPRPIQVGSGRAACFSTIILVHIIVTKINHWSSIMVKGELHQILGFFWNRRRGEN